MERNRSDFLEALGHLEEPMGMFYTDVEPAEGFTPKQGAAFSYEMEQRAEVDWRVLWQNFSCVMGNIWLARKKNNAAYFDAQHYGCVGGSFYLGFHKPQLDFIAHYISTGCADQTQGERYLRSPDSARRFFTEIDPRPAPARFCVFKPLSRFQQGESPEIVTFFVRGEALSGLCVLATFVTDDFEVVAAPFGAGCSFLVTWPLHYLAQGKFKAVLGSPDPSNRKFLKTDEMTFSVPYEMYLQMLSSWRESFLAGATWEGVKKKIRRSRQVWGELDE
ncbi:DUF169 domain-containing protein [Desulfoferrobacter suflitae]|uniref:DUF169 domain-containing protein n=1 Tax=Desulfoferrobacter suflitae TaxID=2865782 RepID=UPI0021640B13|nr:DUF169 domain-containing protein [Desulfoferrobacter suflitae]MCK8601366.1 DUF169 domain-containing protein [Desulfoferrobacter suflitae]